MSRDYVLILPREHILKMADMKTFLMSMPLNFYSISSLISQVNNLILLWNINQRKFLTLAITNSLSKQNFYSPKLKRLRRRRNLRKKRSCWHQPGRTDLWWENIRNGISPSESLKKNFRLSKEEFMVLSDELRPYHIKPSFSKLTFLECGKKLL